MGDGGTGHWLVRMEWRPAGWSVCLPLLIFPCTIKSRSSLLAPAHPGGPGKRAVKRLWCDGRCGLKGQWVFKANNNTTVTYLLHTAAEYVHTTVTKECKRVTAKFRIKAGNRSRSVSVNKVCFWRQRQINERQSQRRENTKLHRGMLTTITLLWRRKTSSNRQEWQKWNVLCRLRKKESSATVNIKCRYALPVHTGLKNAPVLTARTEGPYVPRAYAGVGWRG